MTRIYLIHWNADERIEKMRQLNSAGFSVVSDLPNGSNFARVVEEQAPEVILIDLSRLPSQGRDLGVMMRSRKGTRSIPILFVEGAKEKVEAIQHLLPDAIYSTWAEIVHAINEAIESKGKKFTAQTSVFAAYAGKPLVEKLGIKPGSRVSLINAPENLENKINNLLINTNLIHEVDPQTNLYLWFVHTREEVTKQINDIVTQSKQAPSWIAWPKKGSGIASDLDQQTIRAAAMTAGMVDYKICSIDEHWSALLFKWRG